jgi:toxin YoeB
MAKRKKISWSDKARQDLVNILDYYHKRNGNIGYSQKLYSKIKQDISLLSSQSFLGKQTDHENVRVIIIDSYLIFYEIISDTIFITNIWDSRREPFDLGKGNS